MFSIVFFTSLSSIAFEILLTRVFSISQWNHLSFMVISLALFGLAASGSFLGIYHRYHTAWPAGFSTKGHVGLLVLLYVTSAVLSFLFVNNLPLDYFKLPVQPLQGLYLLAAYISLALPFFFAGMIITIAYITMPEKTGYVYFMNMCGSAVGAFIPMILLSRIEEGRLIMLAAVVPLSACFLLSMRNSRKAIASPRSAKRFNPGRIYAFTSILLTLLAIFILVQHPAMLKVKPSDYKALSQLLQLPDTYITETASGIRGRIDTVKGPFLRFFPGLSLSYTGALPPQFAAFKDGDGPLTCYEDTPELWEFPKHTLAYAGYRLSDKPDRVLVIQNGGGSALACAIASGASHLTVIEKHPRFAKILQDHYRIPVISQSPRSFLARSTESYRIIHLENWGTSLPGTASLSQDTLFTTQAFRSYIDHLSADGLLILSRRLLLPPSQMVRLCATVLEALTSLDVPAPQRHVLILRNWDTFTLVVSRRPLLDLSPIETFCREKNFDRVWPAVPGSPWINHFNKFENLFIFQPSTP